MYRKIEKYDNPLVSDNYSSENETGIASYRNDRGLNNNGKEDYDYYINFNENDKDLMLDIYKKINKCLSFFTFSLENAHNTYKIVGLTNKESIKIIALYDIHQKEIEIEVLKIQLKGLK